MSAATPTRLEEPLDTTVELATPERIVFHYPLAGPFRRSVSYVIDFAFLGLVIGIAVFALTISFGIVGGAGVGLGMAFVIIFVVVWGYGAFCEGVFNGQTLGKRLLGIRVVSDQGVPITGAQAVLRNLVGTMDGPVLFFMLGLASMFLTRKFQRLGDLAAGTMVVVEERRRRIGVLRISDPALTKLLDWLPARIEAGPELAQALSDYVKHRNRFSRARREEMTQDLARPLRKRYDLPDDVPGDLVLCAVYHRVFVGE